MDLISEYSYMCTTCMITFKFAMTEPNMHLAYAAKITH